MKALYQRIRTLNGKNYGLYKSLADKPWDFGDFFLEFLHVQGDPYAPASRLLIRTKLPMLGFDTKWSADFERRLALSDFLHRKLYALVAEKYPEKDGAITFPKIGPEMLVRNSLWIDNGEIRVCLQVKLPGEGRKIQSEAAAEILTMVLPDLVSAALYYNKSDEEILQKHYLVLAKRKAILAEIEKNNLAAFVPNGAILPRESGLSENPKTDAIPFESPKQMEVTLDVLGEKIKGMGVPKGLTVITGGAFHGKSTLLSALVKAVHPHIYGDGREGIVVDESALRINVEDGRSVRNTDLSFFVRDLPGGISTKDFSTLSASGSTSEAANLIEAIEAGATTFFIDEDSSAVNFLIRDSRVRNLLGDEREPLIPLTDRILEICNSGFNFILVAGACGDYLDLADNVIVMANYKAECAKLNGIGINGGENIFNKKTATDFNSSNHKIFPPRNFSKYMEPLQKGVRQTSLVEKLVKVKMSGDYLIQIGFLLSDTSKLNTLVDKQQRFGAGFILLNLLQNAASNNSDSNTSIIDTIKKLCENIQNVGFRNLPQGLSREMSLPRAVDIACVAFRLRGN